MGHKLSKIALRDQKNPASLSLTDCDLQDGGFPFLVSTIHAHGGLEYLSVRSSRIDDALVEELAGALASLHSLKSLRLGGNIIGEAGCRALVTLLQDPNCNIVSLDLKYDCISDDGVAALADAIPNNHKLKRLSLDCDRGTTKASWDALSQALLFNHTLERLAFFDKQKGNSAARRVIASYLEMNRSSPNKRQVAAKKILRHNSHICMKSLFEWDFKMLPLVVKWFDYAKACNNEGGDTRDIDTRKLIAIYQFVRGMPGELERSEPHSESPK